MIRAGRNGAATQLTQAIRLTGLVSALIWNINVVKRGISGPNHAAKDALLYFTAPINSAALELHIDPGTGRVRRAREADYSCPLIIHQEKTQRGGGLGSCSPCTQQHFDGEAMDAGGSVVRPSVTPALNTLRAKQRLSFTQTMRAQCVTRINTRHFPIQPISCRLCAQERPDRELSPFCRHRL